MTKDEALRKALEALEEPKEHIAKHRRLEAITAIKEVLAQPEQEPVAWLHRQGNFTEACMNPLHDDEIDRGWTQEPLYTTPPQREWVGLTDEQIEYYILHRLGGVATKKNLVNLIRLCESKLKEKNNA